MKPYQYHWNDDTKRIIIFNIAARWTWDDALEIIQTQLAMMETVTHKVHTFFVFDGTANLIPQGSAFVNLKRLINMGHRNEDMVVFVGQHLMLQMFLNAVSTAYKLTKQTSRYRFVRSIEEAFLLVEEREASLKTAE